MEGKRTMTWNMRYNFLCIEAKWRDDRVCKPILLPELHSDFVFLWASFRRKAWHSEQLQWHCCFASNHNSRIWFFPLCNTLSTYKSIIEMLLSLLCFITKFDLEKNTVAAQTAYHVYLSLCLCAVPHSLLLNT